jgi:hypothetical protein
VIPTHSPSLPQPIFEIVQQSPLEGVGLYPALSGNSPRVIPPPSVIQPPPIVIPLAPIVIPLAPTVIPHLMRDPRCGRAAMDPA